MKLPHFTLTASLVLFAGAAAAIQPVEAGLQPLQKRLADIHREMQPLDLQLEAPETLPAIRVAAYWRYKLLDAEQKNLLQDIERAKQWAASPLVNHLGSAHWAGSLTGLSPFPRR